MKTESMYACMKLKMLIGDEMSSLLFLYRLNRGLFVPVLFIVFIPYFNHRKLLRKDFLLFK